MPDLANLDDLFRVGHFEVVGAAASDLHCTGLNSAGVRGYRFDFFFHSNNAAAAYQWYPNGAAPAANTAGTVGITNGAPFTVANELHVVAGSVDDRHAGQLWLLNGRSAVLANRRTLITHMALWSEADAPPTPDAIEARAVWKDAALITSWTLHSSLASLGVGSYIDVWGLR